MNLSIFPAKLQGKIRIPESKSELHRALICAALSGTPSLVRCCEPSADVEETVEGLRALGASVTYTENRYYVNGIAAGYGMPQIHCRESGSTLRFLLAVSAALGCGADFILGEQLEKRPLSPLLDLFSANGCEVQVRDETILLRGKLQTACYQIETSVTSQYLSGLLMALPLLPGASVRVPDSKMVSRSYVNLTCNIMEHYGVQVSCRDGAYVTNGTYNGTKSFEPEGDWSAAAFWVVANALGSDILLEGLNLSSLQGDRKVEELIKDIRRGCSIIDLSNVPDLLPPLAVLSAVTAGRTEFINGKRLRGKESDRILSVCQMIQNLGGSCTETTDGLIVTGSRDLRGGIVDSFGDHRIAMAAALAATVCRNPVTIIGAQCVSKSYPVFWEHYQRVGGEIHV